MTTKRMLSIGEARNLITKADQMVKDHKGYGYRFGQALWNLIPCEVIESITCTEDDFFHMKDRDIILGILYNKLVDCSIERE